MSKNFLYFLIAISLANLINAQNGSQKLQEGYGPGPLFSFGQNILKKRLLVVESSLGYQQHSHDQSIFAFFNELLYGVTDNFSLLVELPTIVYRKLDHRKTTGIGDLLIQGEYVFLRKKQDHAKIYATCVGALYLPTAFPFKRNPLHRLATGTFEPFVGLTMAYISKWYLYSQAGILFTSKRDHLRLGEELVFNWGLGRELIKNSYYLALILEMNDNYYFKNKLHRITVKDSGGNIFYIGPSLRYAYKKSLYQIGIQIPAAQTVKPKVKYRIAVEGAWIF